MWRMNTIKNLILLGWHSTQDQSGNQKDSSTNFSTASYAGFNLVRTSDHYLIMIKYAAFLDTRHLRGAKYYWYISHGDFHALFHQTSVCITLSCVVLSSIPNIVYVIHQLIVIFPHLPPHDDHDVVGIQLFH